MGVVSSSQPFPVPRHEPHLCLCVWECLLALCWKCIVPENLLSFQSGRRQLWGQSGLVSFRDGLEQSLRRIRRAEYCQSSAFISHLTVFASCFRLLCICTADNVPCPVQPSRSQGLLEEYLFSASLCGLGCHKMGFWGGSGGGEVSLTCTNTLRVLEASFGGWCWCTWGPL